MPALTIDDLPSAPSRSNVANFNADAEAFVAGLETFVAQAQAFIDYLNNNSTIIGDELNATTIGLTTPAAGKFTTLLADSLGGDAVQSGPMDTTAGRLLKTDAFGVAKSLPIPNGNIDAAVVGGRYHGYGGAHALATIGDNPFPVMNGAFALEVAKLSVGGSTEYLMQCVIGLAGNDAGRFLWRIRTTDAAGWGVWTEAVRTDGGQAISGNFTVDTDTLHVNSGTSMVGVGTTNPEAALHVASDSIGIVVGEHADNTDKHSRIGFMHRNLGEEPVCALNYYADEVRSLLTIGGGTSLLNTATELRFHTAPNNATVTGDERMRIDSDGNVGIGDTTPDARLDVYNNDSGTCVEMTVGSGNTSNNNVLLLAHQYASFSNDALRVNVTRAATSAYALATFRSGGGADTEFRFAGDGNGFCDGSWTGGGADYAEFFEWADGNPAGEDRRGLSVVLDGDKIRQAQDGEQPIGVISANPSVIGDGDIDRWKGKYLRDDFGAFLWEDYEALSWTEIVTETETVRKQATEPQEQTREVIEMLDGKAVKRTIADTVQVPLFDEFPLVDEAGNDLGIHRVPRMVEVQHETTKELPRSYAADEVPEGIFVPADAERAIQQRRKLNPAYDPAQEYVPRAERKEWDTVGLMGKLRLRKGQPVGANWILMRDVSADVEEWLVR